MDQNQNGAERNRYALSAERKNSLLAQLLLSESFEDNEKKEEEKEEEEKTLSFSLITKNRKTRVTLEKIEPTVHDIILPPRKNLNYTLWSTTDVKMFLGAFLDEKTTKSIIEHEVSGRNLYYCFLDKETSEKWRRKVGLSTGCLLKVRMTLGNIHNKFYQI